MTRTVSKNIEQELELDLVTHTYVQKQHGRLSSVTEILTDLGFIHPEHYTEAARARGQAVHQACHYLDENDLAWETVPKGLEGYVRAWEKYKRETGFVPHIIERPFYHPQYLYAGTPDRIGIPGTNPGTPNGIIDIKSGSPEPWHALQLAAYQDLALNLGFNTLYRYGVYLQSDGNYKVIPYRDTNDRAQWLACVSNFFWKKNHR